MGLLDLFRQKRAEEQKPPRDLDGLERERLVYGGRVQAVGFRFQAENLARRVGVTGWVRNVDDGTVELEVQGTPEELEQFRAGIREMSEDPKMSPDAKLWEREKIKTLSEKSFRTRY